MKEIYNATEAARLLGVSDKTITRRLVKRAKHAAPFPKNELGEWQIPLEWLTKHPEWATRPGTDTDRTDDQTPPNGQADTIPDTAPDTTGQSAGLNSNEAPDTVDGVVDRTTLNRTDAAGHPAPDMTGTELVVHLAAIEHHEGEPDGITAEQFLAAMQQMIESNRETKAELKEARAEIKAMGEAQNQLPEQVREIVSKALETLDVQGSDHVKQIVADAVTEAVSAQVQPLQKQIEDVQNTTGDGLARMSGTLENLVEQPKKSPGLWARLFGKG